MSKAKTHVVQASRPATAPRSPQPVTSNGNPEFYAAQRERATGNCFTPKPKRTARKGRSRGGRERMALRDF